MQNPGRLHVLIAGAGIGGLSAAIALRQQGHIVDVYESSRFASEVGAAIHIQPNASGFLRRLGLPPENYRSPQVEHVTVFDQHGTVMSSNDVRNLADAYPFPWQLCHRVDLHEALKAKALAIDGPGDPIRIHLRSRIIDCDPEKPSLTLADGQEVKGDLVIGADGVHSVLRKIISQENIYPEPSGTAAFRLIIPVDKVRANPATRHLVERTGQLQLWDGKYRRMIIYPCRSVKHGCFPGSYIDVSSDNEELNFVGLHPANREEGELEGYQALSSKEHLLKVFEDFSPAMQSLLGMADPEAIRVWPLLDQQALGTWINGKSCLLGDAAHPFLPRKFSHQGQGGAQAMEDAAALGALLPSRTRREDVPGRLQMYMKCRYHRATMVQNYTRQVAAVISGKSSNDIVSDPLEFLRIVFEHDAWDYASNMLRKTLGSLPPSVSPLSQIFGPSTPLLSSFASVHEVLGEPSQRTLEIKFRAHRTQLEALLSTVDARLAAFGGWGGASWVIRRIKAEEWGGNTGVNVLALRIFNARLTADAKPEPFVPLLFADKPEFVIAGREELGLPVLLADLQERMVGSQYQLALEQSGHQFMELNAGLVPRLNKGSEPNGTRDVCKGHATITVTALRPEALDTVFPGLAFVIRQLQELKFEDPDVALLNI
ncbi:FAD/NAD(P)-binding domain-containing protein [Penicillium capsulatum]|uniref:FAD/NAD(P)-binding domain-containing protein n=1 Tax=Penicillium capsulatum TaxID=69766 RepID=A0A9W9IM51_9EURO|nr:FAD/NAD(P)-binding domain-containing protein [Penicillium capsulatum]KAJ6122673.1 FAD/NAD(P)-binding domain-containing protein [Penicillium capsulatum]